jgi:hypothetical protein
MKSNKQRRAEIMARRAAKKSMLAPAATMTYRYGAPDQYVPVPFTCRDCGAAEVWSVKGQKWWYETMRAHPFSTAIRCRPCRARERERKQLARQDMLAGLMKKQEKTLEALAKNENSNTHR